MLRADTKNTSLFDLLLETEEGREMLRRYFLEGDFFKIVTNGEDAKFTMLCSFTSTPVGRQILQQLLADVSFRERLLQDLAFIPALLKSVEDGEYKGTSSFIWLVGTDTGHQILQQLLADVSFRERLLHDPAFISVLLKSVEGGEDKGTSSLYWLTTKDTKSRILQQLLADVSFRERLLRDSAFILALLKSVEDGTSPLYWLTGSTTGHQILQQILADVTSRERLLQDLAFIPAFLKSVEDGVGKDTSPLYGLAGMETGHQILQQLLTDVFFRERLLQDSTFIPALLKSVDGGVLKDTSPLYGFAGTDTGRQILQQILANVPFREKLLHDTAFIPALLKIVGGDVLKDTSTLFKLTWTETGHQILQQLLTDVFFRERLLQDAAFIPVLLKIVENGGNKDTSPLYWLLGRDSGRQILKQLLSDVSFRARLLQDAAFIPALLKSMEGGINKDTSPLYWLTTNTQGQAILKGMLKEPGLKEALCQEIAFIRGLFLQTTLGGDSAFSNLLNTLGGFDVIQSLMESKYFRANFWRHFDMALPGESISWVYRSMAGFTLFKLLLQEKKLELLRIPLQELIEHPQIQLYVRQGVLDLNLFLLISATETGDAYFKFLHHPQCTPWATTDKGYSVKSMIETSSLEESERKERIRALELKIETYQQEISKHGIITRPYALNTLISAAVQTQSPALPIATEILFKIEGVEDSLIQAFQQRIDWFCSQPSFAAYHGLFKALLNNVLLHNLNDFPMIAVDLTELCLWMNGYLQAKVGLPEPECDWEFDIGHLCAEGVQSTLRQMFAMLSRQSEVALYLQHVMNTTGADYCRLLGIARNMEVHLPKAAVMAEMGLVSALPTHDIYLRNLNARQKSWIAQSAMDILIHQDGLISFLVDRLSFGVQEITYVELMKKYFHYRHTSLFGSEITVMAFMSFVTGLSQDELACRDYSDTRLLPIRPDLTVQLTEKATAYATHLPFYVDRKVFEEKNELLWRFLMINPNQLLKEERAIMDEFLSQCERSSDGLAFIKHCIESHRDALLDESNWDRILNALFYQNRKGISLFSLLMANPLFTEWLFDYHLVVTQNREEEPCLDFSERNSWMHPLKKALFSSEKTTSALESAMLQPGTLFFWLYYFQQDAQRLELFQAMMCFIVGSPKKLYTYDSLSPVLFDMLRSMKVSVEHKVLVESFLEARFSEQVKGCDAHCWLTISLLPSPQEMILTTLRANPWALKTLRNREHLVTLRCLIPDDRVFEDIQTLLQRERDARRGHSMFGAASPDKDIPHKAQDTNPSNRG